MVFGHLKISVVPQTLRGKGPKDPLDVFLILKPACGQYSISFKVLHFYLHLISIAHLVAKDMTNSEVQSKVKHEKLSPL